MKDTAGNEIYTTFPQCECNFTAGCEKCNPYMGNKGVLKIKTNFNTHDTCKHQWVRRIRYLISIIKQLK